MNKIIIANWKMNPTSLEEATELFKDEVAQAKKFPSITTIICPPFVYLEELAKLGTDFLGAQDIFWKESGPFTGEISTEMLKNFGVSHVLIGHSDRRYVMGESDEMINKKVQAALDSNITPVLLVGERSKEDNRKEVLRIQLATDLKNVKIDDIGRILIAYEPVWAISTSGNAQPDSPENTIEAIKIIREFLSEEFNRDFSALPILYGGSVNENNVASLLSHPEISGAVIGGASLRKDEFANIFKIVMSL